MNNKLRRLFCTAIVCFIQTQYVYAADYKVIFAVDLIRHGDRTPTIELPNDTHHWQEGLGQLTALGHQQLFTIGKSLRYKYVEQLHLLPPAYKVETIRVRSSDIDRTLMSGEALLTGLYPPGTGPKNDTRFALPHGYQPIPIHTTAREVDELMLPMHTQAETFKKLLQRYVYTQPEWLEKEKRYRGKLALWQKKTSYPLQQLKDIISLGDALYVRECHHIDQPASLTPDEVQEIIQLAEWGLAAKFKPQPIGKYIAHNFLVNLKNEFDNFLNHRDIKQKYLLFLGHDTNLLSILSAFEIPLAMPPSYGADLRFELLEDELKQIWVRTSYNQQPLRLPACKGEFCSWHEFTNLIH